MKMYRLLPDGTPQQVQSMQLAECAKRVRRTDVGSASVSTVFLGIDHNFRGEGPPVLFEIMIVGGSTGDPMARYENIDHALVAHEEAVAFLCSLAPRATVVEASAEELAGP